jgi:hypothetical protein
VWVRVGYSQRYGNRSGSAMRYQLNQVNGSTACARPMQRCSSDVAPRRDYAMAISAVQLAVQHAAPSGSGPVCRCSGLEGSIECHRRRTAPTISACVSLRTSVPVCSIYSKNLLSPQHHRIRNTQATRVVCQQMREHGRARSLARSSDQLSNLSIAGHHSGYPR